MGCQNKPTQIRTPPVEDTPAGRTYWQRGVQIRVRADFREGDEDSFFSFQSPAVQRIARTPSLNCLSIEILTKPLIH